MVPQDKLTNVKTGSGYVVGEVADRVPHLSYLPVGALVTMFDGLDTCLDYITTEMPEPGGYHDSSTDEGTGGFHAFETYDEAMDTFRNHPEKVVEFDPSELRIKDENESGTRVEYDVVGDYIDMGRYMEGIPESIGTMHNGNARNRRMNISLNLNQSADIDHKVIQHRGERILRLVDALEAGGVRCQLTAIESTQCDHFEVKIKRHEEPLTIADLAVVSHPEFLRRTIFRVIEHSKTVDGGYGRPHLLGDTLDAKKLHTENNDEMNLFIDGNFYSEKQVDDRFDDLEKLLVWEMSKPVPEVDAIKVSRDGVYFEPNGTRSDDEIRREGRDVINEK